MRILQSEKQWYFQSKSETMKKGDKTNVTAQQSG
jgi:hypothetical protein